MYLIFFSNCKITRGNKRSLLLDLQREKYMLIPNSMADFLIGNKNKSRDEIYNFYDIKEHPAISEYFVWLEENEVITWVNNIEEAAFFPDLPESFDTPYEISNIIIDFDGEYSTWENIFFQIEEMNIPNVQIRSYQKRSFEFYSLILALTKKSSIKYLEIITPFMDNTKEEIKSFLRQNLRLQFLIFHTAPKNKIEKYKTANVIYQRSSINNCSACGNINPSYFTCNLELYVEGLKFNTCLNKKISIDNNGEIKNCPSMEKNFGNIKNVTLKDALVKIGFKFYWKIKKGDIKVCQDCEFRDVCTDCRAYLQEPKNIFSKPLKCGYDPYTGIWEDWSKNPLNKNAIKYYKFSSEVN